MQTWQRIHRVRSAKTRFRTGWHTAGRAASTTRPDREGIDTLQAFLAGEMLTADLP